MGKISCDGYMLWERWFKKVMSIITSIKINKKKIMVKWGEENRWRNIPNTKKLKIIEMVIWNLWKMVKRTKIIFTGSMKIQIVGIPVDESRYFKIKFSVSEIYLYVN